jgi:hypothetical protein
MSDYIIAALLVITAVAFNLHLDGAKEVRLLAKCNDRILSAYHEDEFPEGCTWVEPIKVDGQPLEYN